MEMWFLKRWQIILWTDIKNEESGILSDILIKHHSNVTNKKIIY